MERAVKHEYYLHSQGNGHHRPDDAGRRWADHKPDTGAVGALSLIHISPGFKAKTQIRAHNVHQIIEAPFEGHSKKPDETRRRIVELLGDVPRLEMFARQRADGWDAWGNEAPEA